MGIKEISEQASEEFRKMQNDKDTSGCEKMKDAIEILSDHIDYNPIGQANTTEDDEYNLEETNTVCINETENAENRNFIAKTTSCKESLDQKKIQSSELESLKENKVQTCTSSESTNKEEVCEGDDIVNTDVEHSDATLDSKLALSSEKIAQDKKLSDSSTKDCVGTEDKDNNKITTLSHAENKMALKETIADSILSPEIVFSQEKKVKSNDQLEDTNDNCGTSSEITGENVKTELETWSRKTELLEKRENSLTLIQMEEDSQQENEIVIIHDKPKSEKPHIMKNKLDMDTVKADVKDIEKMQESEMITMVNLKEETLVELKLDDIEKVFASTDTDKTKEHKNDDK